SRGRAGKPSGRVEWMSATTTAASVKSSAALAAMPPLATLSSIPPELAKVVRTDCANSPSVVNKTALVFAACAEPFNMTRSQSSCSPRLPPRCPRHRIRVADLRAGAASLVAGRSTVPCYVTHASTRSSLRISAGNDRGRRGGRKRRSLVRAVAFDGALHALAVRLHVAVGGGARPRIDD